MAQRRVPLDRWTPDLPRLESAGLQIAKNCVRRANGYGPFGSLLEIGSFGAITTAVRGSIHLNDIDGVPNNFAGDSTKLWRIQAGAWTNVSKAGNYTLGANSRWESVIYSSNATGRKPLVIFTCYDAPIQAYEVGTSALFADLAAAAPKARHIGVIASHVMVGYTSDPVDGKVTNRVWWPAIGNASSWPTPGTDPAISAESDYNVLFGDYGDITGIVGGSTWGTVFQERAVWRVDYVGGSTMFNFSRIESQRGMVIPGLAVPIGNRILYFSDDGWYVFDGAGSAPVGKDVVDAWFKREFQFEFRHRVSTIPDPDLPLVHIGFTGSANDAGTPNLILHYNWRENSWSYSEVQHDQLALVVNPGVDLSMDRSPSPIPDQSTSSWDDVATSTRTAGGFTTAHKLAGFTGPALAARFETGDYELAPGRRSITRFVRPIVTDGTPTVSIAKKATINAALSYSAPAALDASGKCGLRADGRYHALRLDIASAWQGDAVALDIESSPTGSR